VLEYCYLRKEGHAAAQAPPADREEAEPPTAASVAGSARPADPPDFAPGFAWTVRLRQPTAGEDERQAKLVQANEKLPGKAASRHYTYRREYVKCGKKGCSCAKGKGHGPYWYAYWREGKKLKKKYLGKKRTGGG
jgi:hypothetical protein